VLSILVLVGRILYVAIFLASGVRHVTQSEAMAGYTRSKGVPAARAAVVASGALMLAGSVMVLLGVWADLGALFLVAFLLPSALIMHAFWRVPDAMARQGDRTHFMKDISMAGAGIALFALIAYAGHHLGLTLTGPLVHLS
jgi:putative oxidoreductase